MYTATELEADLRNWIDGSQGRASVLVQVDGEDVVSISPEGMYEAASLAKLGIAVYFMYGVWWQRRFDLSDKLVLKDEHKRPGAGKLQNMAAGTELELRELLDLMLITSDNTAVNVLLDHYVTQGEIVSDLQVLIPGVITTGLTHRTDRVYESGRARPCDIMAILREALHERGILRRLQSAYLMHGDRLFGTRQRDWPGRGYEANWQRLKLRWSRDPYRVSSLVRQSPRSPNVAAKTGDLKWEGIRYRHIAGQFVGTGPQPLFVVCTAGMSRQEVREICHMINVWHKQTVRDWPNR